MENVEAPFTTNELISAVALIRSEFSGLTISELKKLTETDRVELASAIAAQRGLTPDKLSFTPVEY